MGHERPRGNRRIIALVRQHGGGAGGGFRGPRRARHEQQAAAPAEHIVAIAVGGRRGGDGGGDRCASGGGGASGGKVLKEGPTSLRSAPRSRARPLPRQPVQHAPDRRFKAGDERAGVPPLPAPPNHRRPRRERVTIRRSSRTRSVGRHQARTRARRCRAPPLPLPRRPPVGCGGGQPVGCRAEAADELCRRRWGKCPRPPPPQRPRGRPGAGRVAGMADHLRRGGERQGGRDRPTGGGARAVVFAAITVGAVVSVVAVTATAALSVCGAVVGVCAAALPAAHGNWRRRRRRRLPPARPGGAAGELVEHLRCHADHGRVARGGSSGGGGGGGGGDRPTVAVAMADESVGPTRMAASNGALPRRARATDRLG